MEDQTTFEYVAKALLMLFIFGITYTSKVVFGHKRKNNSQGQFIVKRDEQYIAEKNKPADTYNKPQDNTYSKTNADALKLNRPSKSSVQDECPWEGKKKRNSREDKIE